MQADHSISASSVTVAQELAATMPDPAPAIVSSMDGSLAFIHQHFPASAGAMGHPTQLRLALVVSGGGRLQQRCTRNPTLDALWGVGQFNIVLPGQTGTYASPAVEILGLAFDWPSMAGVSINLPTLAPLAGAVHRDATVSALLHALWSAHRSDVLTDSLLRACAEAVVGRLGLLAQGTVALPNATRPLSVDQLRVLTDYIDSARDTRPSVPMMAEALRMDEVRFSRAVQSATGMSPYQFLVHHRMHWARHELERGQSVMEVAQSVGYANASKFSAAFRRVIGDRPSASRR